MIKIGADMINIQISLIVKRDNFELKGCVLFWAGLSHWYGDLRGGNLLATFQKKSNIDELVEFSKWVKSCISDRLAYGCRNSIALYLRSWSSIMLSSQIWSYISPCRLLSVCRWLGLTQKDSRSSLYGSKPISCTGSLRLFLPLFTFLSLEDSINFVFSGLNLNIAKNWMLVTADELS